MPELALALASYTTSWDATDWERGWKEKDMRFTRRASVWIGMARDPFELPNGTPALSEVALRLEAASGSN